MLSFMFTCYKQSKKRSICSIYNAHMYMCSNCKQSRENTFVQRGQLPRSFKETFLLLHSAEKEREQSRVILILSDKKKSFFFLPHKMSQYSSCMYLNTSVRDFLSTMYAHLLVVIVLHIDSKDNIFY